MADEEDRGNGGGVHDANAQESQVSIGTGERTGVGEISLTENLNDTRHIDILIKQSNGPRPQASGVGAAQEDTAALNGRLKITVVVEKDTDEEKREEDKLMAMRGWLMTVGTLFVTMAFQAALQPPAWLRTVDFLRYDQPVINLFKHPFRGASHAAATAPSPGPSPQDAESPTGLSARARAYMYCNVFTFASALSLVLLLLWDIPRGRAKRTMKAAAWMMVVIGLGVVATFALGSSADWSFTLIVGIGVVGYAGIVVMCVNYTWIRDRFVKTFAIIKYLRRRTGERPARSPDHAS